MGGAINGNNESIQAALYSLAGILLIQEMSVRRADGIDIFMNLILLLSISQAFDLFNNHPSPQP